MKKQNLAFKKLFSKLLAAKPEASWSLANLRWVRWWAIPSNADHF